MTQAENMSALAEQRVFKGLSQRELIQHGLAPMYAWLGANGRHGRESAVNDLKNEMKQSIMWWELQWREICDLRDKCSEAGIPIAFLKGTDLNLRCYPVVGIRPMVDIDVLVRGNQQGRMVELLRESGYHSLDHEDDPRVSTAFETRWSRREGMMIEVHTCPDWSEAIGVETGQLLDRRVFLQPGETPVLDGPDLLLNLATHAMRDMHAAWRKSALDAYFVITSLNMSWDDVLARAAGWEARAALYVLLARSRDHVGTPVPGAVLDELSAGLVPDLLARWLSKHVDPPVALKRDWLERLVRLAMVESFPRRLKFAGRYAGLRLTDWLRSLSVARLSRH